MTERKCTLCEESIQSGMLICEKCGKPIDMEAKKYTEKRDARAKNFRYLNYSPDSFVYIAWTWFISGMMVWPFACIVLLDEYMSHNIWGYPSQYSSEAKVFMNGMFLAAFIGFLVSTCSWLLLTYRCWAIIQDSDNARTTPFLASFLLLVPVVNIFWQFAAWPGLVTDMNNYADRLKINESYRGFGGLAVFACVINILVLCISFFIFIPFAFSLAKTAQAIQGKKLEAI